MCCDMVKEVIITVKEVKLFPASTKRGQLFIFSTKCHGTRSKMFIQGHLSVELTWPIADIKSCSWLAAVTAKAATVNRLEQKSTDDYYVQGKCQRNSRQMGIRNIY